METKVQNSAKNASRFGYRCQTVHQWHRNERVGTYLKYSFNYQLLFFKLILRNYFFGYVSALQSLLLLLGQLVYKFKQKIKLKAELEY